MFIFLNNSLEGHSVSTKKERQKIDYDFLYSEIKRRGTITTAELQRLTGTSRSGVQNVITILSIDYPIWQPSRGVYASI